MHIILPGTAFTQIVSADQNYGQIVAPPPKPTYPRSNHFFYIAITRNFPYPYTHSNGERFIVR